MKMPDLTFDIRDIFMAPRYAWSLRKMHAAIRGVLSSWFIYLVFTYGTLLLTSTGKSTGLIQLFRYYEFCPYPESDFNAGWQLLVFAAGIILACIPLLTAMTAIARITFEDVRGNDVYQAHDAIQFAKKHRLSVLVSVGILCLLFCLFPLSQIVWGFIGNIPVIGPVLFGIISLPLFLWGLLGIAVCVVCTFGFWLVPVITATAGDDVLETIIQTFSAVFYRPFRLLFYEVAANIVTLFSSLVLIVFMGLSMIMAIVFCGLSFGETFGQLVTITLYRVPGAVAFLEYVSYLYDTSHVLSWLPLTYTTQAAFPVRLGGWMAGLSLLFVFAWIVSYGFTCFSCSRLFLYLALRKQKDGVDLRLEQSPAEFTPEAQKEV